MNWLGRIQLIIGIWIFISPWALGYASLSPLLWNNIIIGAVVALMGLWEIFDAPDENQ
jgi:hypothetical protein